MDLIPYTTISTGEYYSPHDQLPCPVPMTSTYYPRHFYENTCKHLVRDTVRIMMNGLHIDMEKVAELEKVLDDQLVKVAATLSTSTNIQKYLDKRYSSQLSKYKLDRQSKLRDATYYLKEFKPKDMVHRSYYMKLFAAEQGIIPPTEEVLPGVPKWPVKLVRKLSATRPVLVRLLNGELPQSNRLVKQCMQELAEYRAALYNKSYKAQIASPEVDRPTFNPSSPLQKQELFEMLGIESEATTASGAPQWDRAQIVNVNIGTTDPDIKEFTSALIEHSYAAIVKSNFIEGFYKYTINDRLYGTYRLIGAKTARYTSSKPNMLNAPSTRSVFATPIKNCFTAPKGFVVAMIDYAALEDRVTANLTKDPVKLGIFTDDLDGHSVAATYYHTERVKELVGDYGSDFRDHVEASKFFRALVDDEDNLLHSKAKRIRQESKAPSFKLAYGGYPDIHKGGLITQHLFDLYHYKLYVGVSRFREDYVIPTAKSNGSLHLGLGFRIHTDDADRDSRSINNSCSQFWSILSILAISKLHQLIDDAGLQECVIVTATIYDSIYLEIIDDPEVIKWVNDCIVPIMEKDFMENQIVANSARLEIGPSWADLYELPDGADVKHIANILETIKTKDTTC